LRLIIDGPVADRRLGMPQMAPRKVIADFRQVVAGRLRLGRENNNIFRARLLGWRYA
jgi:hypothetical protein